MLLTPVLKPGIELATIMSQNPKPSVTGRPARLNARCQGDHPVAMTLPQQEADLLLLQQQPGAAKTCMHR